MTKLDSLTILEYVHLKKKQSKFTYYEHSFKWRILSQTSTEGSGKNIYFFIFPTGLQVHLEDMF